MWPDWAGLVLAARVSLKGKGKHPFCVQCWLLRQTLPASVFISKDWGESASQVAAWLIFYWGSPPKTIALYSKSMGLFNAMFSTLPYI